MKIAFVCPHFYPHIGGVETVVLQLATNLAALGHEVTVLTLRSHPQSPKIETFHNFTIIRFNSVGVGDLKISFSLLNYLRKNAGTYDVIHSHNYHSFPALSAALTKKTPIIFSPHYHGTGQTKITRALYNPYMKIGKHIFSRSEAILCDTYAESLLLKKHFPHLKKIVITPLGIDVEGIVKTPRQKTSPYVLSVGRLENYKNVQSIIYALQFLDKKVHLKIVGDGTQKQHLQNIAHKLNLSDRITFLGNVKTEELFKLLKNAKAFVTMSTVEAYGLSLLEATAAQIGVVASDIPAHKELVKKFKIRSVFLLKPHSPAADLALTITSAIANPTQTGKKLPSWSYVTQLALQQYNHALSI